MAESDAPASPQEKLLDDWFEAKADRDEAIAAAWAGDPETRAEAIAAAKKKWAEARDKLTARQVALSAKEG